MSTRRPSAGPFALYEVLAAVTLALVALMTAAGLATMARRGAGWLHLDQVRPARGLVEAARAHPAGPERDRLLREAVAELQMYSRLSRVGGPRDYTFLLREADPAPPPPR